MNGMTEIEENMCKLFFESDSMLHLHFKLVLVVTMDIGTSPMECIILHFETVKTIHFEPF